MMRGGRDYGNENRLPLDQVWIALLGKLDIELGNTVVVVVLVDKPRKKKYYQFEFAFKVWPQF